MNRPLSVALVIALVFLVGATASFAAFDPYLHGKAQDYQDWLMQWHSGSLGGLMAEVEFTDDTFTELNYTHDQGDSMIWTGMYLAVQAIRYRITGDEEAREEIIRIVDYMDMAMDITGTPGYLPRYAGIDEFPFNAEYGPENPRTRYGEGDWEGYYWVTETSRDQYVGYMMGMVMAYEVIDDPDTIAKIRYGVTACVDRFVQHRWRVIDDQGNPTGVADSVAYLKRLQFIHAAGVVTDDDPYYRNLFDVEWQKARPFLMFDMWALYSKYFEYYGNNLKHTSILNLLRLLDNQTYVAELQDIFMTWVRPHVEHTHNPWFDIVYVAGCHRLGNCDENELEFIRQDTAETLGIFWEVPNIRREIICSDMPLDPVSVFLVNVSEALPFLADIMDVETMTKDPRILTDRPWDDMYWQRTPFTGECHTRPELTRVGFGLDYLLGYWLSVYYGILPADGPFDIEPPFGDDDDDVVSDDDDTVVADDDDEASGTEPPNDDDAIDDDDDNADSGNNSDNDDDQAGCGG